MKKENNLYLKNIYKYYIRNLRIKYMFNIIFALFILSPTSIFNQQNIVCKNNIEKYKIEATKALTKLSFFNTSNLRNYCGFNTNMQITDVIVCCGNNYIGTVRETFELWEKSYATIIFTGGVGGGTQDLFYNYNPAVLKQKIMALKNLKCVKKVYLGNKKDFRDVITESELFCEIFLEFCIQNGYKLSDFNIVYSNELHKLNPKKYNIILENQSISTAENMQNTSLILERLKTISVIVVQNPLQQLRTYLLAHKFFGTVKVYSYAEYINPDILGITKMLDEILKIYQRNYLTDEFSNEFFCGIKFYSNLYQAS